MFADDPQLLPNEPRSWLVTGCAGFIGSHLVQSLLRLGQHVTGLDNFASGSAANLEAVKRQVGSGLWERFRLVEGDIRSKSDCDEAARGAEVVLHQAALVSVPLSLECPELAHETNVTGFLNVLIAARRAGAKRVVFASSSAVYGDADRVPHTEDHIGRPLSPYAATKRMDEIYADSFGMSYGMECIGLRYFNVYGPRQDPNGPYAAVIPRWMSALAALERPTINGSGQITRDFVHVEDVVQANLRAAVSADESALNRVFNIGQGRETTLFELFAQIRAAIGRYVPDALSLEPSIGPPRQGDILRSAADIRAARMLLGYTPRVSLDDGLSRLAQEL